MNLAKIYVTRESILPAGIKTLLANNRIPYVEIDVTDDAEMRTHVIERAGRPDGL